MCGLCFTQISYVRSDCGEGTGFGDCSLGFFDGGDLVAILTSRHYVETCVQQVGRGDNQAGILFAHDSRERKTHPIAVNIGIACCESKIRRSVFVRV